MTILSNKNTPRVSYTASDSQTVFAIPFEFFNVADVKVYNGTTLLTYNASPSTTSQYSITGTASSSDEAYEFGAGGSITLGSTGASADDIITIIRDISIERTSDFPAVGSFDITALNTQLDQIIAEIADRKQQSDRSIKLADSDSVVADLTLPAKATRASKVFSFTADGEPESTLNTSGLTTLSAIPDDISTVAGIAAHVTTCAGISANITSVAGDATDIGAVAAKATEIGRLGTADAVADLALLGTSAIVTDLDVLADKVTEIGRLGESSVIANMALLGTSDAVADMAILATTDIVTDLAQLATTDFVSDLNQLATSDFVADLTAVEAIKANVTTVADNLAGVTSFAERYRVGSTNPSSSLDDGDLFFNTSDNALKYYNGTSWESITAGIGSLADDTTPELGGDLSLNGNNIDFPTTANISDCLDEDTMSSNSATKLATQQSIKAYADTKLANVSEDTTPQLGGDLDINGNDIVSVSNGDITITPNGTGDVIIDGLKYPQADGTGGYFLKTNGSAQLSWASAVETKPTISSLTPSVITNAATNVVIAGTGFSAIPRIHAIDTASGIWYEATSVTYTSATSITANFTLAVDSDNYRVRVENPDGNSVISAADALNVSDVPVWTTAAGSLGTIAGDFSGTVATVVATGTGVEFTEVSGTGLTGSGNANCALSTGGVITTSDFGGSSTTATLYSFTIRATDDEGQTADRVFTLQSSFGATGGGQFN
tara:strand:- start:1728 stop:3899 length:2172 start_codon:yes stop_codon:yes gene_type:complete